MSSANITLFSYALVIFLGEAALIQSLTLHKHGSADCSALEFKPSSVKLYAQVYINFKLTESEGLRQKTGKSAKFWQKTGTFTHI